MAPGTVPLAVDGKPLARPASGGAEYDFELGYNRTTLPFIKAVQSGRLRALARVPAERALISRLELTAFQRPARVLQFAAADFDVSAALWFEPRPFGLKLGIVEGLALRSGCAPDLALRVGADAGSMITHFTTVSDEEFGSGRSAETATIPAARDWRLTRTRERFREVLPLAPSYEETLTTFGRHTRRNVRNVRKAATDRGLVFTISQEGTGIPKPVRLALGRQTRPYPLFERRMRPFEAYADTAGDLFRSVVASPTGEVISYCCGFLDDKVAYVVYQLNSCKWAELSPSLMHRGYLIEALIGLGCREVVFIHGCSGVLRHACLPIVLDRYLVVRNTAAALATAALIRKLAPKSRMGRILNAPIRGGQSGSKLDRQPGTDDSHIPSQCSPEQQSTPRYEG